MTTAHHYFDSATDPGRVQLECLGTCWTSQQPRSSTSARVGFADALAGRAGRADGAAGGRPMRSYFTQLKAGLLAAGITGEELTTVTDLMLDPRFHAWFFEVVLTGGRKSA